MDDLEVAVPGGLGALVEVARVLGAAGIGLEGGGMWAGSAHYLLRDGAAASAVLAAAGIGPVTVRPVVLADLDVDGPGALARLLDRLVVVGAQIVAQYSDHDNRKVLVVADAQAARAVRAALTG